MHADDIEPLEAGHWIRRVRQLAMRPLDDEADLERALRHAFHLVQLVPRPLRHVVHCTDDEAEFEVLLEAGAFEAAAVRLMGSRILYCLDTFGDEPMVTAEVWYADQSDRHSATERTTASALLRAWLRCNQALDAPDPLFPGVPASAPTPGVTRTEH